MTANSSEMEILRQMLRRIIDANDVAWLPWCADALEASRPDSGNRARRLRELDKAIQDADEHIPNVYTIGQ